MKLKGQTEGTGNGILGFPLVGILGFPLLPHCLTDLVVEDDLQPSL